MPTPTPNRLPAPSTEPPFAHSANGGQSTSAAWPVDRKRRKTTRSNLARKRKRLSAKEKNFGLAEPRPEVYDKYLGAARLVRSDLKAANVRTTKSAYTGLNHKVQEQSVIALEDLLGPDTQWKFKLQKWDGK